MPKRQHRPPNTIPKDAATLRPSTPVAISAEVALSFLKDTKGALTWSVRELADTLKIHRSDADRVIALLQAQGYVRPAQSNAEWITTPSGEIVSGAKSPRFDRKSLEQALTSLKGSIQQLNLDRSVAFKINEAVAFGDFLNKDRARVQAADVGIALSPRGEGRNPASDLRTASGAREERAFFRQLRGKTALVVLKPYAAWMKQRSHVNLI